MGGMDLQAGSCRQGAAGRDLQAGSCRQGAASRELRAGSCRQYNLQAGSCLESFVFSFLVLASNMFWPAKLCQVRDVANLNNGNRCVETCVAIIRCCTSLQVTVGLEHPHGSWSLDRSYFNFCLNVHV